MVLGRLGRHPEHGEVTHGRVQLPGAGEQQSLLPPFMGVAHVIGVDAQVVPFQVEDEVSLRRGDS